MTYIIGGVKRLACLCFLATIAAAHADTGGDTGTTARSSPADYDAQQKIPGATIAASLISPANAAKVFSSATSKNFLIVEVAVFPESGRTFDLEILDFALKTADDRALAVTAEEVAWYGKQRPNSSAPGIGPAGDIHVTSEAGIAVGTRTNPVTGKTEHGVATYEGVAVDNRPRNDPPRSNTADSTYVLEGKLRGLEVQEGQTARPISGYLYFPAPKKHKSTNIALEYSRGGDRATLALPIH